MSISAYDTDRMTFGIEESKIPFPIRFNSLKHHRNYILHILENTNPELIISLLDPVCNNYTDIYTGTMTPEAICLEVVDKLKSDLVFQANDFARWVDSKSGYRQIKLRDQSEWVVRKSNETERYIHLHPAREGWFTIRFKGSTLKTAYLLKAGFSNLPELPSLEKVNRARMQVGLSPVKRLERNKGILNCFGKFFSPE
jgi:hypothetical protein